MVKLINDAETHILVTGGLGFIGSHVVVKLIELRLNVIIIDNLSNSDISTIHKIKQITESKKDFVFLQGDICNENFINDVFLSYNINIVMHFAALKSVTESQLYPELYYKVNVEGTKTLLNVMTSHNCHRFIYSSSATVYGNSKSPVSEQSEIGNNLSCNYAKNKYEIEKYLFDNFKDHDIIILRYFNPIGAHSSGIIGENPSGIPNNIFPYLTRVAQWTNNPYSDPLSPYIIFTIFGNDYDTIDGTCIRDYVHVDDLAQAHIEVMNLIGDDKKHTIYGKIKIYNVGTGTGSTVLQLINNLNQVLIENNKKPIQYQFGSRRPGDLDVCFGNVDKIYTDIGFKTKHGIKKMCQDGLNFIFSYSQ